MTIHLAQPPPPRAFVCAGCRARIEVETRTGPLPTKCDTCDPASAQRRRWQSQRLKGRHGRSYAQRAHDAEKIAAAAREEARRLRAELRDTRRSRTLFQRKAEQATEVRRQLDAALTKIARLEQAAQDRPPARAAAALDRTIEPTAVNHTPGQSARLVRLTRLLGEPGRESLGRAVRRVATASGAKGTSDALRDLAVIAEGWADRLSAPSADIHERTEKRLATIAANRTAAA